MQGEKRMGDRPRVGYIGVGLMGHGAAKNILAKGYPLTILGNRNRAPVDDLVQRGAREAASLADLAANADIVFTCLPSSVEVESTVLGADGLLVHFRRGMIHVDSTTADPNSTRRLGALYAERGCAMVDAPLGRTPKEAEEGRLNTFLGGDPAAVATVKPVIASYADTVIEAGPLGSGHTLKLVNNFISIGTSAVIAEAVATAAKLGVDLRKLFEVVSSGGANSAMFQMVMPWVLDGDDSRLKGPLRIAGKDLRFYCRLAESATAPAFVAQAASQLYQLANARGHGERFMPTLPGILAELIGSKIRDLP
jgi:3-hydroxyisobutyrate dehydrogenase-like beta-hydroxyacid dehydrogenase